MKSTDTTGRFTRLKERRPSLPYSRRLLGPSARVQEVGIRRTEMLKTEEDPQEDQSQHYHTDVENTRQQQKKNYEHHVLDKRKKKKKTRQSY